MGSFIVLPGAGAQIAGALQQMGANLHAAAAPEAQIRMAFDQMLITNPEAADVLASTFRPEEGEEFSGVLAEIVGEERARGIASRPPSLQENIRDEAVKQWEALSVEEKASFVRENHFGLSPLETMQTKVGIEAFTLISQLGSGEIKEKDLTSGQMLLLESVFTNLFDQQGTASQASFFANARPVFDRLVKNGFTDFSMLDVIQYTMDPTARPDITEALNQVHAAEVEQRDIKQERQGRQDRSIIVGRIATLQNRVTGIQTQLDAKRIDPKNAETQLENMVIALNSQFRELESAGGSPLEAKFVPKVGLLKGMFTSAKRGDPGIQVVNRETGEAVTAEEVLAQGASSVEPESPPIPEGRPEPAAVDSTQIDLSNFNASEREDIAALAATAPEDQAAIIQLLKDRNRPFYDKLIEAGIIR